MNSRLKAALGLGLFLAGPGMAVAETLENVRTRGMLICGPIRPPQDFSMPDNDGNWTGFDVDYCRAVAAAVLGDPDKVRFIPLEAKDRFTALQTGEIDILAHNATWTSSRDASLGILFAGIYFYDGQGFHGASRVGRPMRRSLTAPRSASRRAPPRSSISPTFSAPME